MSDEAGTPGRFILSFDCEGRWGVSDRPRSRHAAALTERTLRTVYRSLLALLDEFDVPATFGFVGAFSLGPGRLRELRPGMVELARLVPGYLEPAIAAIGARDYDGWVGDWAVEAVATARTRHEIALHGATHIPWDWPGMTADIARRELGLVADHAAPILSEVSTYIYPRNATRYHEVLDEFGIAGARARRPASSRAASLLSEFDLRSVPDAIPVSTHPVTIPAGYFVNWLRGPRKLVPRAVSRTRAARMLATASHTGGVVHYWSHPENFASGPGTLTLLRQIVREAARMRDEGRCTVLTQAAYCEEVDAAHCRSMAARRQARLAG